MSGEKHAREGYTWWSDPIQADQWRGGERWQVDEEIRNRTVQEAPWQPVATEPLRNIFVSLSSCALSTGRVEPKARSVDSIKAPDTP